MNELAQYKLFLSDSSYESNSSPYYSNDYYSNPVRNLYRSWPVSYTPRRSDEIAEDLVEELIGEY